MWRCEDLGQLGQSPVFRGFIDKHVERGTGDVPGLNRVKQSLFVNDPAAGSIDQPDTFLHLGDACRIDQTFCLGGHRSMNCEKITLANEIIDIAIKFDPFGTGSFFREKRIITQNFHFKRNTTAGHGQANSSETNHGNRLTRELRSGETFPIPLACLHGCGSRANIAGHRQQQRHRLFGGRGRVTGRGIHHHDPFARGGGQVDVIDADPSPNDDLQSGLILEDLGSQLRGTPNDDPIDILKKFANLFGRMLTTAIDDLDTRGLLKDLEARC